VALVVMAALAWICLSPREVYYADKPLTYWLKMLNEVTPGFDPPPEWQALGADEVPVLIKALELRDSKVRAVHEKLVNSAWNGSGPAVLKKLPVPWHTEDMAINALMYLARIGARGRPAIPAMIHVLKADRSGFLRDMAAECLSEMEPNDEIVRRALIKSLSDTNLNPIMVTSVSNRLKPSAAEIVGKARAK
jgi:hypothetical protein